MAARIDYNHIARVVAEMSREQIEQELLHFNGRFELDFTEDFLEQLSEDRLRHILLSARLQHQKNLSS